MRPRKKKLCFALNWLLPIALLAGCATQSPSLGVSCPAIPPAPALRQPLPQQSYLANARANIETWQKELSDMLQTLP